MRYRLVEKREIEEHQPQEEPRSSQSYKAKEAASRLSEPTLPPQHSNHQAGATIAKNVFPLPYLTTKEKTMEVMLFWGGSPLQLLQNHTIGNVATSKRLGIIPENSRQSRNSV